MRRMPDPTQTDVIHLRDWLYPDRIQPGQRVRCQMPGCRTLLGRSGQHLLFRSLRENDAALPPEWVGWHCARCGRLNTYCPLD